MSPRHRPLHQQFVRLLLLPLVAAFLLALGATVLLSYTLELEKQVSSRTQVLRLYERSLHKPLWDCDSDTARGIVDTLAYLPEVDHVRLQDVCAGSLITAGTATTDHADADVDANHLQMPVIYRDAKGRSFAVGHLDVRFHPVSLLSAALHALWRYSVIFVLVLGLLFVGAALIFRQIIGRPLAQLLDAIHAHRRVDVPTCPLTLASNAPFEDELSEVVHAYNGLVDTNARQTQELAQAIQKLRQNEKHLVHAARQDPLTGLGNRLALEEALSSAIARTQRSGNGGHVLMLDLNRFKPINDEHGHAAGDAVLKAVAQRLLASVRTTDTVARLGGDEFVVVVEDPTSVAGLETLRKTILTAVAQPIFLPGMALSVHASIGTASFLQDGKDSTALLAHADKSMYAHKAANQQAGQVPR